MAASPSEAAAAGSRDLRRRLLSALVLAPVAAAAILLDDRTAGVFIALMAAAMVWEVWRMAAPAGAGGEVRAIAMVVAIVSPALAVAAAAWGDVAVGWAIALIVAGAAALYLAHGRSAVAPTRRWIAAAFVVVIAGAATFADLRIGAFGALVALWLVAVVAAADTGAYFFGRLIGGPRLWPRVSPKKTWAGLFAALLCGGGAAVAALALQERPISGGAFLCGVVIALAAQGGDLAESAFKRRFDRKDASGLIPGHGGVLDRMDSLIGATFAVALAKAFGVDIWGGS